MDSDLIWVMVGAPVTRKSPTSIPNHRKKYYLSSNNDILTIRHHLAAPKQPHRRMRIPGTFFSICIVFCTNIENLTEIVSSTCSIQWKKTRRQQTCFLFTGATQCFQSCVKDIMMHVVCPDCSKSPLSPTNKFSEH